MNFGQAVEAAKAGKLIQRSGWNGKGMFVFQRPSDVLTAEFIQKVKSLPEAAKKWIEENNGEQPVVFTAYLCMKAADGRIQNGWLATQTDILAEDWQILE